MRPISEAPADIEFRRFRVLPKRRELLVDNQPVRIGGRAFDVLLALIDARGAVVGKDALMARIWPDKIVEENNLQVQISILRGVFGKDRDLIRTVSGRGYQFTDEIRFLPERPKEPVNTGTVEPQSRFVLRSTNLPELVSELIGRDEEISEIVNLAAAHRLITLTGPGGIGKTRLALALARELLPHFADGVWLAEFSPIADPGLVPATVAAAVGLDLGGGDASAQRVAQALAGRRALLVLDTCEHVIDAAAALTEAVLQSGSTIHVIATSREPLRAEGERVYPVPALSVPAADAAPDEDLPEYGAVRLFTERARATEPHFAPQRRLVATIASICRRVDGIPLAIELAAARAATLGIEELAARLDDRFQLLTGGRRTALPRHQTLRAALDWSYQLLLEPERVVLSRLAIFAGPFALDAAARVAASPEISAPQVVDSVASLMAKSLLAAIVEGPVTRYRLLDTTRAYALEKLGECGELKTIARRHAQFYRALFERADSERGTRAPVEWLAGYGWQINNLRAALEWAFSANGDASIGTALAAAAAALWMQLSLLEECRNWCERALTSLDESDRGAKQEMILQEALALSSMFTRGNSDQVRAAIDRGLALAEALQDRPHQLQLLAGLNIFLTRIGDFRGALAIAERGGAVAHAAKDPAGVIMAEWMLGVSHHLVGNQAAAQLHCERGVAEAAHLGAFNVDFFGYDHRVRALVALARAQWLRGFADQAVKTAEEAIDEAAKRDQPVSVCIALIYGSTVFVWSGNLQRAEDFIERLIAYARRNTLAPYIAVGTGLKGELAVARGAPEAGFDLLKSAIETLSAEQHNILLTVFESALAECLRKTEEFDQALVTIDTAIARASNSGASYDMAELLRIKAQILADMPGQDRAAAIDGITAALAVAREQSALALELRSTMALARLLAGSGQQDRARNALTLVYDRFAEGFETADLRSARCLIDDLT